MVTSDVEEDPASGTMNIREATVSAPVTGSEGRRLADNLLQINDQLGMQNCNLHNLPENYTMRYCEWWGKDTRLWLG